MKHVGTRRDDTVYMFKDIYISILATPGCKRDLSKYNQRSSNCCEHSFHLIQCTAHASVTMIYKLS